MSLCNYEDVNTYYQLYAVYDYSTVCSRLYVRHAMSCIIDRMLCTTCHHFTCVYHTILYFMLFYHTMPHRTIPYHTIQELPFLYCTVMLVAMYICYEYSIPGFAMTYPTLPHHTMPCHTTPYDAQPYPTIQDDTTLYS